MRRATIFAGLLALAPIGCGDDDPYPGRVPVSLSLKLDGEPLKDGVVNLIPTGPGPAVTGQVVGGSLDVPASLGPTPGVYRVEIRSVQPTGRTIVDPDDGRTKIEETRDLIPPRYNLESGLKAEVKPGEENRFAWELSSAPASKPGNPRRR